MDFCHIYQEMFTALQQGGLDRVWAAYRIMDMPVMIADTSYVVTAMYPEEETGGSAVGQQQDGEPILVEAIISYQYDGHWNAIREAREPCTSTGDTARNTPSTRPWWKKEDKVLGSLAF